MQDRNNIPNNKSDVADKDSKQKSGTPDQKSRTEGQPDRDRQSSTERQGERR